VIVRFWCHLDSWWHRLRLPGGWVCDRYDLALGLTRAELTRR
jgi:hypothetical protein